MMSFIPAEKCVLCQEPAEPCRPWDAVWDRKCAQSICRLLELDQKDIPVLFQNLNYCSPCHEFIRDVDFTMRSLTALQEKSRELKSILSQLLVPKQLYSGNDSNSAAATDIDVTLTEENLQHTKTTDTETGGLLAVTPNIVTILDMKKEIDESRLREDYDDSLMEYETTECMSMDVKQGPYKEGSLDCAFDEEELSSDEVDDSSLGSDLDYSEAERDVDPKNARTQNQRSGGTPNKSLANAPSMTHREEKRVEIALRISRIEFGDPVFDPEIDKFNCEIDGCTFTSQSVDWMKVHTVEHQASTKPNLDEPNSTFGCPVCNMHFAKITIYESHMDRVHRPNVGTPTQIRCPHCPKKFGKNGLSPRLFTRFHRHFQDIHVPREYETDTRRCTFLCPVWDCRARFRAQKDRQAHCENEYLFDPKVDKLICKIEGCSFRGRSEGWMIVHEVEHQAATTPNSDTPNSTYACPVCNLHFATLSIYQSHLERIHRPTVGCPTVLQCPHCFMEFGKTGGRMLRTPFIKYRKHFEGVHVKEYPRTDPRRKQYPCPVFQCLTRFRTKTHLDIHYRKFHEKDPTPFKCDACSKAYTNAAYLRVHKSKYHTGPNLLCPVCREGFPNKPSMITHIKRLHSSTEKYQCDICKWKFFYKEDCDAHEKLHEPKFICVLGKCKLNRLKYPQDYGNETELREHIEENHIAHGRLIRCKVCHNQFHSKAALDNHVENKHNPNTTKTVYKCTLCPKTFKFRQRLYQHRSQHKHNPNAFLAKKSNQPPRKVRAGTATGVRASKRKRKTRVRVAESDSD